MADKTPKPPKTIVFFHPDLGIGGAERLVIDAAVGLQNRGHRVVIFTSHRDPAHCFDEARPRAAGGILDVRVRGGSVVPATVLGRLAILCAIARQVHLVLAIWLSGELAALHASALFVDQLSAGLPLLKVISPGAPIFFYCHFPDLLLATGRQASWWKRAYRVPFDALEQWSMGFADAVAVNSRFTKSVVTATWPRLAEQLGGGTTMDDDKGLRVVYPCIDLTQTTSDDNPSDNNAPPLDRPFVLSINRFERKKNIALAIRAFAGLPPAQRARGGARLVVAGGYDSRVAENVEYHAELVRLADELGLTSATVKTYSEELPDAQVLFLLSIPSTLKTRLLHSTACRLLAYTPANEHFGIVPLEAMLAGVPVLACDSGGPTETVVEGATGWLRAGDDEAAWTAVMARVLPGGSEGGGDGLTAAQRQAMADAGRQRVRSLFADTQMAARLDGILDEIIQRAGDSTATSAAWLGGLLAAVVALAGLAVAVGVALYRGI